MRGPFRCLPTSHHASRIRAFTLVELLVVIAIIGVLVSLLLPAVQASRESARQASCANNLKQMGLAIENYQNSKQLYPPSTNLDLTNNWSYLEQHSWASLILPYQEQGNLFDTINFERPLRHRDNLPIATTIISIYRCPTYTGPEFSEARPYLHANGDFAIGNYVAFSASDIPHIWEYNLEPEGVIYPVSEIRPADVTDGLSHTVLIAESREEELRVWMDGLTAANTALPEGENLNPRRAPRRIALNYSPYYPDNGYYSEYGPSSMHPGGAYHLVADGSVRFLTDDIAPSNYVAFCTRAGQEVLDGVN